MHIFQKEEIHVWGKVMLFCANAPFAAVLKLEDARQILTVAHPAIPLAFC